MAPITKPHLCTVGMVWSDLLLIDVQRSMAVQIVYSGSRRFPSCKLLEDSEGANHSHSRKVELAPQTCEMSLPLIHQITKAYPTLRSSRFISHQDPPPTGFPVPAAISLACNSLLPRCMVLNASGTAHCLCRLQPVVGGSQACEKKNTSHFVALIQYWNCAN